MVFDKLPSLLRQSRVGADAPVSDNPGRQLPIDTKRQTSLATAALVGASETASPKLEEFCRMTRDLCIRAHNIWILWLSDELSVILSRDLGQDDSLSSTTPLRVCDIYGQLCSLYLLRFSFKYMLCPVLLHAFVSFRVSQV